MKTSTVNENHPKQSEKGAEAIHAFIHRIAFWKRFPQPARMIVATMIGLLLVVAGVIMLFTPGQGVLTILAGLAVLGTEFHWARNSLNWCHEMGHRGWVWLKEWWKSGKKSKADPVSDETKEIPRG